MRKKRLSALVTLIGRGNKSWIKTEIFNYSRSIKLVIGLSCLGNFFFVRKEVCWIFRKPPKRFFCFQIQIFEKLWSDEIVFSVC